MTIQTEAAAIQPNETSVAHALKPVVLLVAITSLAVAGLLVTTASLGASPVNASQYASLQ